MNTFKTLIAVVFLRSVFKLMDWALSRVSASTVANEGDEYAAA